MSPLAPLRRRPAHSSLPLRLARHRHTAAAAFCRVTGTIAPVPESEIRFEVWLPTAWNSKFVGIGNGGASGLIFYPHMAEPLTRGYAVAATDTGHSGGMADWSFAVHARS